MLHFPHQMLITFISIPIQHLYVIFNFFQVHSKAMVERKKQMLKSKQKVPTFIYQNSVAHLLTSVGANADGCGDSLHTLLLPTQHRLGKLALKDILRTLRDDGMTFYPCPAEVYIS